MPIQHRRIPALPERPSGDPIGSQISRSYPVGRQHFSRASQGETLVLTITSADPLPETVAVSLATTLNSNGGDSWLEVPFVRTDDRTFTCTVTAEHPGFFSFRAEFSRDSGATWLRDNVPDAWVLIDPPQVDAVRLYSLIPTVSGTVADWKADLRRIRDMGFNAVHLLPVTELDTSESPYAAKYLFGIDPSYFMGGSPEDGLAQLEDFIEEARTLDMRLCFDLVLNHVGVHSAMAQRAPNWIVPDQNQPDGFQRARYWTNDGWRSWDDIVVINYDHPSDEIRAEIYAYMTDYALFWAKYADYTGGFVRLDNLHGSDPEFIQALTEAMHSEYPEVGILAEYFTDEGTLLRAGSEWRLNLILATAWNYKFVPQLRDYLKYIHRLSEQIRYFMPITSHDSGAPAQEFGTADSTVPRYVTAALMGTGATGIPQGVELGEAERVDFIGRKPKMVYPAEPRFAPFFRQVNAILAENHAFRCGKNCLFVDGGHDAILAMYRRDQGTLGFGFLVVCNFDTGHEQRISIDLQVHFASEGPHRCLELLSGETKIYPSGRFDLSLPPCGAMVLRIPESLIEQ
jgi:glycogen debranching enzyme-like protein